MEINALLYFLDADKSQFIIVVIDYTHTHQYVCWKESTDIVAGRYEDHTIKFAVYVVANYSTNTVYLNNDCNNFFNLKKLI
jgi:hypothetical protein